MKKNKKLKTNPRKSILSTMVKVNILTIIVMLVICILFGFIFLLTPLGFSFSVLEKKLPPSGLTFKSNELAEENFKATENNLGVILLPLKSINIKDWDKITFRIREKTHRKWYAQNTYKATRVLYRDYLVFGFPQIIDSKNKRYEVELKVTPKKKDIPIFSKKEDLFLSAAYKFSGDALFKDQWALAKFTLAKITSGIRSVKVVDVLSVYLFSLVISIICFTIKKYARKIYNFPVANRYLARFLPSFFLNSKKETNKIAYLDGLRGWAAFIVVLNHFFALFYPALFSGAVAQAHLPGGAEIILPGSPLNILYNGTFAVCIFFILSGYVLTHKFFVKKDYEIIVSGTVRRYFRLLFPVAFSTIVAYFFMRFSLFNPSNSGILTGSWIYIFWSFKPNFFQMLEQGFFGAFFFSNHKAYNFVLWTMYYEFYGSMLVFSVAALFYNTRNRYIFYAILIFLTINTYFVAFIFGLVLCDFSVNKPNFFKKMPQFFALGILLLGIFIGSYPFPLDASTTIYRFMVIKTDLIPNPVILYQIIGAFLVFIGVLGSKKAKSLLSHKSSVMLGKIAFSMYVIHTIIIASFTSYIFLLLLKYVSYNVAFLIAFPLSLSVILVCSYFVYKYVDLNGIKFSKYVYNKYFRVKN